MIPAADLTGKALGHFRIVARLGAGGMGVVYQAMDEKLRRPVALKVLPPELVGDEERRQRFLREARSAAALTHPNIATVYEVGEADGQVFIAMELVEGRTLRERIAGGALPVEQALRVGRGIARGLARAHQAGVVHRDLKPDNVILGADDHVKLLDFGLAKLFDPATASASQQTETASGVTEEGRVLGTPGYMSPEQTRGKQVDVRTDVFSFGIVLYEMLTGARPFKGDTGMDLLTAILRDPAPPASESNPGVPAELDRMVARCLEKEPAARFADGAALVGALEAMLTRSSLSQRVPLAARGAIARKWIALGAVAVALGIGGIGARRVLVRAPARGVPITELPVPTSPSVEAVSAYREGLQMWRDGAAAGAVAKYRDAVRLDPALAAAHVRLVLVGLRGEPDVARKHFERASALRGSLSEHDRVLLDAVSPCVHGEGFDFAGCVNRLKAAVEAHPYDADYAALLAELYFDSGELGLSLAAHRHALEVDPQSADLLSGMGYVQAYSGDREGALRTWSRCLEVSPMASNCLRCRAELYAEEGRCDLLEADARRVVAMDPGNTLGYGLLANAYLSEGRPLESVRETLSQAGRHTPEAFRRSNEELLGARLATIEGDFAAVERHARTLEELTVQESNEEAHAEPARLLVRLYGESGRAREAAAVADTFLRRRGAWFPDPRSDDFAIRKDPTPLMLEAQLRAGTRSAESYSQGIADYLAKWRRQSPPFYQKYLWLHGYAATAESAEEGNAALAALPAFAPLPPFRPQTIAVAHLGRAFQLAGRLDDALPSLEAAAHHCFPLTFPFEQTRAYLFVGQARAAKGDQKGACAAFRVVLDRWGKAVPRSITAEQARAAARTAGCAI